MSALIAGRLPGSGSKLVRQTIETTNPARPGDVLTIVARVTDKVAEGRRVTIEVRATNQHGDLAMTGTAEVVAPKKADRGRAARGIRRGDAREGPPLPAADRGHRGR